MAAPDLDGHVASESPDTPIRDRRGGEGKPSRQTLRDVLKRSAHLNLSGLIVKESSNARTGGTYADVYVGRWQWRKEIVSEGNLVAIRQLRSNLFTDEVLEKSIALELRIWENLDHPNVLPLLGFTMDFGPYPAFITEWMSNGTVLDYLSQKSNVDNVHLVYGIAKGLAYLHKNAIVHSDLKCANILVSPKGVPMLMDFGHSRLTDMSRKILTTREMAGTVRWMAVELFGVEDNGTPPFATKASDVWSFGMTTFEILSRQVPYAQHKYEGPIMLAIVNGELPHAPIQTRNSKSQTWRQGLLWRLCKRCWKRVPTERPSMYELLEEIEFFEAMWRTYQRSFGHFSCA
ncbi:kinase-like protein [Rickenella mellea]|uniref:Kinase-like protein n=1 Tax=Rickenella mellea TaxID=50990 RepID=A0A4Y7PPF5_9AGAM|nr:kinase-like protein [Rickenella mellea]